MNVVGGVVVVGVLGGADERLKGRFGLGGDGEWSRLMHLNLPTSSCSWVHPQVFPLASSPLAEMGVRFWRLPPSYMDKEHLKGMGNQGVV